MNFKLFLKVRLCKIRFALEFIYKLLKTQSFSIVITQFFDSLTHHDFKDPNKMKSSTLKASILLAKPSYTKRSRPSQETEPSSEEKPNLT